ncbi:type II secretion system F family protein [Haloimpatiens sp. FM7330]|uniref:type II secretion system F family protein n=1 Tax=Haloimpatiens sp. FM7330 TaxID=3298610 RepID=UPI00362981D8
MPIYEYKVMNSEGNKLKGTFKASNKNEVLAMIEDNNYYPISIEEILEREQQDILQSLKKVSIKDLYVFCRQFYTMLNAGANISNCINILKEQTENPTLKRSLNEVYEDVQKGVTFSQSLKNQDRVFPELMINMIEAGEVSGKLDVIMNRLASHYERENKINNKIKSAFIYPVILIILSITVVTFLLIFVMPIFVGMFQNSEVSLPLPTRIVLSISTGIKNKWYIILILIGLVVVGIKTYAKSVSGKIFFDNLKLNNPITKGTNIKIILSRFTRTLSTILYSGIPLVQALEVSSKIIGNKVVEKKILQCRDKVIEGESLAETLKTIEIFPSMLSSMIKIGEESGALDDILEKTATFYDEELDTALKKMTAMIEPLMILIMGVLIGFIVISMLMPMFDMFKTIPT